MAIGETFGLVPPYLSPGPAPEAPIGPMNVFCRFFGHTWTHQTENARISWNTTKEQRELKLTTEGEPKFWLQCHRCGLKNENPTRDEVRKINN